MGFAARVLTAWVAQDAATAGRVAAPEDMVAAGVLDDVPEDARADQAVWRWRTYAAELAATAPDTHADADSPAGIEVGSPAPPGAYAGPGAVEDTGCRRRWRCSPEQETSLWRVWAAAVAVGGVVAAGQRQWMEAVRAHPGFAHLTGRRWATTLAVATRLAQWATWETRTTRPTHHVIAAEVGCSVRTVSRVVAQLGAASLLGTVAPGQAGYTRTDVPANPDGTPPANLAAVYVLCVPAPDASDDDRALAPDAGHQGAAAGAEGHVPGSVEMAGGPGPVDNFGDPPTLESVLQRNHPYTRGEPHQTDALRARPEGADAPCGPSQHPGGVVLRPAVPAWSGTGGQDEPGRARPGVNPTPAPVPDPGDRARWAGVGVAGPAWAAGTRRGRKAHRRTLAATLIATCPDLAPLEAAWVAALIRQHAATGWTARDLARALDHTPTGTAHRHGAPPPPAVRTRVTWNHYRRRLAGWVRWRLAQWTGPDTTPLDSPSQTAAKARAATRAAHQALVAEREAWAAQHAAASPHAPAAARAAAAAGLGALERARRRAEAARHPSPDPPDTTTAGAAGPGASRPAPSGVPTREQALASWHVGGSRTPPETGGLPSSGPR